MKKLLLSLVAVAALTAGAQAQTEKGKIILGGNVGFSSTKSDAASKSNTSFQVVPSIGYFVDNNLAVGTGVGYEYSKNIGTSQNEAFKVAPFGRYYAGLSDQFKFFGQLSVPMSFGTAKAVDANGDTGAKIGKSTNIGVALAPGFAFFPSKKVGIEFSVNGLSYKNYKVKDGNGNKIDAASGNSFNLGADFFQPNLGVQFHF